jgi:rubrerythrin
VEGRASAAQAPRDRHLPPHQRGSVAPLILRSSILGTITATSAAPKQSAVRLASASLIGGLAKRERLSEGAALFEVEEAQMYEELKAAGTVATSLKSAFELSKAFLDVKGAVEIQGKVFELQRVILAAQQDALTANEAQATLLKRIRELEEEVASLKTWHAEKAHYELKEVDSGAFTYVLKPSAETGEPPHWLCAACYDDHKAILQDSGRNSKREDQTVYKCPDCKNFILVSYTIKPSTYSDNNQRSAGPPCPICQKPMRTTAVARHPEFGFAGVQQHTLTCSCGHTEERMVDPSKRI